MTTIGALVLITEDERYDECLQSLRELDHIWVFTDRPAIMESVRKRGAHAKLIARPPCIETIGQELISYATTEWLLLIDPDEKFVCADGDALRNLLREAGSAVSGYSIAYRYRFLRHSLDATYKGVRKTKLIRPGSVKWPTTIHSLPVPARQESEFSNLPDSVASIETDLLGDVRLRLARHAQWASVEAAKGSLQPIDTRHIAAALAQTLQEYCEERSCYQDGTAGILNGLLHLNKAIALLLFQAQNSGLKQDIPERVQEAASVMCQAADILTKASERCARSSGEAAKSLCI